MLTLLLVASLCAPQGCGYSDVTKKFPEAKSDRDCLEVALALNLQNVALKGDTRFACMEPEDYYQLVQKQAF